MRSARETPLELDGEDVGETVDCKFLQSWRHIFTAVQTEEIKWKDANTEEIMYSRRTIDASAPKKQSHN